MKRFAVPSIILSLLSGAGVWLYIGMQNSYGPYGTVTRTACISRLRQIGKATLVYSEDFDGRVMLAPTWMDQITKAYRTSENNRKKPILPSVDVLRCFCLSRMGRSGPDVNGYAFHSGVSGKRIADYKILEHTTLAYESKSTYWNAHDALTSFSGPYDPAIPGSGRANMLFLDGHVQRIEKQ